MACSLSNLVNNLSEVIHKNKCSFGHDDKRCETCKIKYKYCNYFLEYRKFKDYQQKFDEKLKERFFNTYTFSNHGNNKFILLFSIDVYPYEYMDN